MLLRRPVGALNRTGRFPLTFFERFRGSSATHLALPDTGLITVNEMLDQGGPSAKRSQSRSSATATPVTATRSTCGAMVEQFSRAGFAGVMIGTRGSQALRAHRRQGGGGPIPRSPRPIRAAVEARTPAPTS